MIQISVLPRVQCYPKAHTIWRTTSTDGTDGIEKSISTSFGTYSTYCTAISFRKVTVDWLICTEVVHTFYFKS